MERVRCELRAFGFNVSDEYQGESPSSSSNDQDHHNLSPQNFNSSREHLLCSDFKTIKNSFTPYLTPDLNTAHSRTLRGPIILQVSSFSNISQPLKRQHDESFPRLLQIKLTDGHMTVTGIEFEQIPEFNKLSPGMKLLLQEGTRVYCGKILLTSTCCRVLGGRVDHLYSAWMTNRHTLTQRKKTPRHEAGDGENKIPPKFEMQINGKKPPRQMDFDLSGMSLSSAAPASSSSRENGPRRGGGAVRGQGRVGKVEGRLARSRDDSDHRPQSADVNRGGSAGRGGSERQSREGRSVGHASDSRERGGRGGHGRGNHHSRGDDHRSPSSGDHHSRRGRGGRGGRESGRGGRGSREGRGREGGGPTSSFNLLDAAWPGL
jgi:hypothetical protein